MPRPARRYDFYLPLATNDGRPIADEVFRAVQRRLLDHFQGLTAHKQTFPLQGIWYGGSRLYLDEVIVMTALDFRPRGSMRFIAQLKKSLLREFDQIEILITEHSLRVH